MADPSYRPNLARIHHEGYAHHAELCGPGMLELLAPTLATDGLVLELGCGSGLLTRILVDAGHRVIATDASPAMLDLARRTASDATAIEILTLPNDPIPEADAIVSIGHVMSYLPSEADIHTALVAAARALRPGGLLAIDLCDLDWGRRWGGRPPEARVTDDWVLVTHFSCPTPERYIRDMTTFVRDDGVWHRDDERHVQVNVATETLPALLSSVGVDAEIRSSFGDETLPEGLVTVIGRKR